MPDIALSRRTAVLVVGPPRSGTSALSHVLSTLGVEFGDPATFIDPDTHTHNPVFFEIAELNDLNDRILAALGWEYGEFAMLVGEDDFDSAFVDRFEPEIADFLERHFGEVSRFGLKDPRFCFTLPLWLAFFERRGIDCRCVLTVRSEEAIAASNFRVNPDRGIEHARRVASLSDAAARCFLASRRHETVRFEALALTEPGAISTISRLAGTTGEQAGQAVAQVFDSALVHWNGSEAATVDATVDDRPAGKRGGETYRALVAAARELGWRPGVERAAAIDQAPRGAPLDFVAWEPARRNAGAVQLFHRDMKSSYCEERSRTVPWPALANDARFNLEFDIPLEPGFLRIDVDDHPGVFVIRTLEFDGAEVAPASLLNGASGALLPAGAGRAVVVLVNHDDPWIEFRVEAAVTRLTVTIERATLAQAGARLIDKDSVLQRLDAMRAQLSRLDDRVGGVGRQLDRRIGELMAVADQDEVIRRLETLHAWQQRSWLRRLRGWLARRTGGVP